MNFLVTIFYELNINYNKLLLQFDVASKMKKSDEVRIEFPNKNGKEEINEIFNNFVFFSFPGNFIKIYHLLPTISSHAFDKIAIQRREN